MSNTPLLLTKGLPLGNITIMTGSRKAGKSVVLEGIKLESKWHKELLAKGWHPVMGTQYFHLNWAACHQECKEIFGEENYTWTGSVFWFKNKEDILVYKLTFSR
jgi:hypothetical protein